MRVNDHGDGIRLILVFLALSLQPLALPAQDALLREDRLLLAEGLFSRGMHALAAEEYAALEPTTPGVLLRLAECHDHLGNNADADAARARLDEKFPASAEAVRVRLLRAQDAEPARVLEILAPLRDWRGDPALETALLLSLADAYSREAKPADAVAAYDDLLRRFPNDKTAPLARLNAGLALLASDSADDHKRGSQYLLHVAREKTDPEWTAESLYALARHEYENKNHADSAGWFALLARECPDSPRTQTSRLQAAWANHLANDRETALALLDAHPVADPQSPDQQSWLYLRANLLRLKNDPASRATYEKLLEDFPDPDIRFLAARHEYATLLFAQKEFEILHAFYQEHHDFPEHTETAAWMQIETAFQTKRHDEFLALCKTFAEKFADSQHLPESLNRAAWIRFVIQKDFSAAAQLYARLAQDHPAFDPGPPQNTWALAAAAWQEAGDATKALDAYQKALDAYGENPDAAPVALALARLALEHENNVV
ncbi:MAG: tetratricopeptide repeat protein, partial [Kiritimatiellaeota bacterium]|nr:tetratricopeptide repeat protein [Kiritimatiellota bacterium]